MSKKNGWLFITLALLTAAYVYYFTDWFTPRVIHIIHTSRLNRISMHPRPGDKPDTAPVMFGLTFRYRLTELKVVPLLEWQTNKNALPIWHLISDSNSIPVKTFFYGQNIRGMKASVPGSHAEPLEPDVTYHMVLAAGSVKGEHDFVAKPAN